MKIDRDQKIAWFAHNEITQTLELGRHDTTLLIKGIIQKASIRLASESTEENIFDNKNATFTFSTQTIAQLHNERWIGKDGGAGAKLKIGAQTYKYQLIMDDLTAQEMSVI